MPLFEVAIIEKPSEKAREEGESEKLIWGPKALIAKDAKSAPAAAMLLAVDQVDKPIKTDLMEVLVRPFC